MMISRRALLNGLTVSPLVAFAPAIIGRSAARAEAVPAAEPMPQISTRRIGAIELTALYDGAVTFTADLLVGFEPSKADAAARIAHKPHDGQSMILGINGYLIKIGDRTIAIDCGAPPAMGPGVGRWHAALAAAGVDADSLDTLVLTHLHPDHVGGLTDLATGERRLPNTRIIAGATDWALAHDEAIYAQTPETFRSFTDTSRALLAPYQDAVELIESGKEIAPGITTVALPGHTPGQFGVRIDDGAESLLIWADALHSPAYQFANPDWSLVFDADPTTAAQTRRRVLDMAASDGMLVAGMHLDMPGFGYVETSGSAWRYVAAPPDYRV